MAAADDESWKDTNVGGIGTDEDKALRKMAAKTEPAWEGVETEEGLKIWRIEHFQVVAVEKDTYGKFHKGDSYIVLYGQKNDDTLVHKIFFWIGGSSTTDEKGTAAYKTVELDDLLDGAAHQIRETEGNESDEFKALFEGGIEYLEGGAPSGFHHVVPEGHDPTLWCIRKVKGKVTEMKVPLKKSAINKTDSFVLDAADKIYVFDGEQAGSFVKAAANSHAERIEGDRASRASATHDIDDGFWALLA